VTDLNVRSKETQLLIKLLSEFKDEPNDLNSLVNALRQKGYCKSLSTAYGYVNRILAIRKIFNINNFEDSPNSIGNENPIQALKKLERKARVADILQEINAYMDAPGHSRAEKQEIIKSGLQDMYRVIMAYLE
jgi:hypothetical protein